MQLLSFFFRDFFGDKIKSRIANCALEHVAQEIRWMLCGTHCPGDPLDVVSVKVLTSLHCRVGVW